MSQPCATLRGYKAHINNHDAPCQTCKDWKEKYDAGLASPEAPIQLPRTGRAGCGTVPGYNNHRRDGQPACRACLDAIANYRRERDGTLALILQECGTAAAHQRHVRNGEPTHPECYKAFLDDHARRKREARARKKATAA